MPYSYRSARGSNRGRQSTRHFSSKKRNKTPTFDPRRFVATAKATQEEPFVPRHAFSDFALDALLQANLQAKGYQTPSPIQDEAIPAGLVGRDVLGMAGTGTGKTAAFALPMLQRLLTDETSAAIIIAPTRELAQQIEVECRSLGKGVGVIGALLIGGEGIGKQLRQLQQQPRIVIGTPGRIKDHIERRSLKLDTFNILVLDEVDRMLDMGFVNDIRSIVSEVSPQRQSLFFSATMNNGVRTLTSDFLRDPIVISIKASAASENVHQDVVAYQTNADKVEQLHDILLREEVTKVIIFDETQRSVERLYEELRSRGFSVESMHGGKAQAHRRRALNKFKSNEITVLVATDVAARGIDVSDISHVINYSLPREYDDYIHRIGRAGRAGRVGYAYTFFPAR